MKHSITCPLCKGVFALPEDHPKSKSQKQTELALKVKRAKYLAGEGYTIRAIMKIMGYRSPRSVAVLLEK